MEIPVFFFLKLALKVFFVLYHYATSFAASITTIPADTFVQQNQGARNKAVICVSLSITCPDESHFLCLECFVAF